MANRRTFLAGGALIGAAAVSRSALASLPEPALRAEPSSALPLPPAAGRP